MNIKYFILGFISTWIVFLTINHYRGEWKADDRIRNLEFQHSRDSLVIDSLKSENQIGGWYEAQWSKETGD